MRLYGLAALLTLGRTVLSAPPPVTGKTAGDPWEYDAVIVGGGPSGLSAASGLARVRRKILLVDSGVYRNQATRHMHDVLGFDGVQPAYYRHAARKQILEYPTVTMRNGTVTQIQTIKTPDYTYFSVVYNSPACGTIKTTAAKIVLGTGLRDKMPTTPGFSENWGKGIYWCPWCDGHEHADQELGIIGPFDQAPSTVLEILTLNKDIIVFVNGTDTPAEEEATTQKIPIWQSIFSENKVQVENRTIKSIVRIRNGSDGYHDPSKASTAELDKFRVEFEQGPPVTRDAFVVNIPNELASSVGPDMGVSVVNGKLKTDNAKGLVTNVPGVYAVGDANSDQSTNVPHALHSGKRSAVFLHVQLAREDADRKAKAGKPTKRSDLDVRSVWEEMNGQQGSLLHAGEF